MRCRNPIEDALTAKAPGNATAVTERAGWRCRKGKFVLRVTRTEAENARTAAEWAVSMLQGVRRQHPPAAIDDL